MRTSPLHSDVELGHALSAAEQMLEDLKNAGGADDASFNLLLNQIADYHDAQPPAQQRANLDRLEGIDRELRAFGRRWHKQDDQGEQHHWSPLLGGDVDPGHQH